MFDLEVFFGPGLVLLAMLTALLGFAVWGSRAIRESAYAAAEAAAKQPEAPVAPTVNAAAESTDIGLLLDNVPAADLEQTAEFAPPAFAQSFLEGEEVKPAAEFDFDAAIERITAGLEAQEAARTETKIEAESEAEDVSEIEGEDASEIVADDDENTRILQPEETAAIMADEAESADTDNTANDNSEQPMEATVVMPKLSVAGVTEENLLDEAALEETRLLNALPQVNAEQSVEFFTGQAGLDVADDGLLPESPLAFGPKMAWLAIPGCKPSEVIAALRLGQVQPANWTKGLTEAYADNNQVFVTPTLSGWVLVVGKTLWQKADMNRSAENIPWLKDVGRLFGNACFYSTMRGLGNHGWVGIRGGNIVRAYGYSGELQELIWFVGEPTEEEIAINPAFANEAAESKQPGFRPVVPDEKMVLAMAAAWSVDVTFGSHKYPPDFGFLGTLE